MQHTFLEAPFVVGEGVARKTGTARDVVLNVEKSPPGNGTEKDSPFLTGRIRAEGVMLEECLPNRSLLAVGREVVLKLTMKDRWALIGVLITKLGTVHTREQGKRLYEWSFLVTGEPRDPLRVFPGPSKGRVSAEALFESLV